MVAVHAIDHVVLTVADLERTCEFYSSALGMAVETFGDGRTALRFGRQKINLHKAGAEFEPKAARPVPGAGDLCFVIEGSLDDMAERLTANGVDILEGPVARTGAVGALESLYIRDPDGNLIELSVYTDEDAAAAPISG